MINIVKYVRSDRRGVAMTEFVATLPVFITVFIAISHMAPMLADGTNAAIAVSQDVWMQASAVAQKKVALSGDSTSRGTWAEGSGKSLARYYSSAIGGVEIAQNALHYEENRKAIEAHLADGSTGLLTVASGDFGEMYGRLGFINVSSLTAVKPRYYPDSISQSGDFLWGSAKVGEEVYDSWWKRKHIEMYMGQRYGTVLGHVEKDFSVGKLKYSVGRKATSLVAPAGGVDIDPFTPGNLVKLVKNPVSFIQGLVEKTAHPWFKVVGPVSGIGMDEYYDIFGMQNENKVDRLNYKAPDVWGKDDSKGHTGPSDPYENPKKPSDEKVKDSKKKGKENEEKHKKEEAEKNKGK